MKCQPKPGHSLGKKNEMYHEMKNGKKRMWGFHTLKKYQNFWGISMKENFFFSKECEVNNLGPLGHTHDFPRKRMSPNQMDYLTQGLATK